MTLRDRIKERLAAIGMKQADLVRSSGVPQSTLASILQRDTRSTPHLMRLAIALKTTPGYLLGETDDPNSQVPETALSYEEQLFFERLRHLSRDDFERISWLVNRLAEPRAGYVYREEDTLSEATFHDRHRDFKPQEEGRKWGD